MGRLPIRPNRLITWGQVYPGHPSLETASASTRSHQGNLATVPDHGDVAQGGMHVDADEDVERMSDNNQDPEPPLQTPRRAKQPKYLRLQSLPNVHAGI